MSRFFSPKYLKYSRAAHGSTEIETDRPCKACGYNLRGLRVGGRCPECGLPILAADAARDALVDAPLAVIKQLRLGFMLVLVCLPLLPTLPISMAVMGQSPAALSAVVLALSVLWVASVWIATPVIRIPDGQRRGFTSRAPLRRGARWLQLGWIVFAVTLVAGGSFGLSVVLAALGSCAGITGVVLLAILLGRLAEWCRDDFAQRAYNVAAWGLGTCYVGILASAVFTPLMLLTCTFTALWMFAIASFLLGTASLGRSVFWAAVIAQQQAERDRRLAAGMTPGPASVDRPTGPVPLSEPDVGVAPGPGFDLPEPR